MARHGLLDRGSIAELPQQALKEVYLFPWKRTISSSVNVRWSERLNSTIEDTTVIVLSVVQGVASPYATEARPKNYVRL